MAKRLDPLTYCLFILYNTFFASQNVLFHLMSSIKLYMYLCEYQFHQNFIQNQMNKFNSLVIENSFVNFFHCNKTYYVVDELLISTLPKLKFKTMNVEVYIEIKKNDCFRYPYLFWSGNWQTNHLDNNSTMLVVVCCFKYLYTVELV